MNLISILEKQNKFLIGFVGYILIGVIGYIDYSTGYEYAFSVFYVLPISLVTWRVNQKFGYITSAISAIAWLIADLGAGHPYSQSVIPFWNSLIRFSFFIIIAFLLSSLKNALKREKELSHTDYLTTASNLRSFYEIVQTEIDRTQRYQRPFTIAYIDVDNFKTVNDKFGHAEGDLVLQTVVNFLKKKLRNSDVVARLGGDEFALLFPETNQESAQTIFNNIHCSLLDEMQKYKWDVTFSIGVLTCEIAPKTTKELIKMADDLMYLAKSDGKNTVKYSVYSG